MNQAEDVGRMMLDLSIEDRDLVVQFAESLRDKRARRTPDLRLVTDNGSEKSDPGPQDPDWYWKARRRNRNHRAYGS